MKRFLFPSLAIFGLLLSAQCFSETFSCYHNSIGVTEGKITIENGTGTFYFLRSLLGKTETKTFQNLECESTGNLVHCTGNGIDYVDFRRTSTFRLENGEVKEDILEVGFYWRDQADKRDTWLIYNLKHCQVN
jgi:hypothetical protein